MRIWRSLDELPADRGRCVVTIGVFDGVHRGHRRLIRRAVEEGARRGLPAVLVTFDPHPLRIIRPEKAPVQLTTPEQRAELAEEFGIEALYVIRFTEEMSRHTPHEFARELLADGLRADAVVVGGNFTFGHRAAGTVETLAELGAEMGFDAIEVPLLAEDGHTVSSTYIRGRLAEGDVAGAAEALARPHRIVGTIVRGAGRGGAELGYPTANLESPPRNAIPADGVYAGWFTVLDDGEIDGSMEPGRAYPAAISVGTNPTFDGEIRTVEAFVLDEQADLYGRVGAIDLVERLRGMERFDGIDDLLVAMDRDVRRTREILGLETAE